jgi:uncharacterized protein (UPF0332 family)
MALAEDLLEQAWHLANLEAKRPKQASLRRAISTAYYAMLHLLVQDAAKRLSPAKPSALAPLIGRAFVHSEMKQACRSIAGQLTSSLLRLQPQGFSPDVLEVAKAFVNLQEERHEADYDLTQIYTRVEVLDLLATAQDAFAVWKRVRQSDEANVFCAALLFHRSWSR